ncbi:MAG: hypothetical protein GXO55_10910 [Chloroflexi bacterium]|nr:hypothetical protein [Chloroflexota bacterium]
MELRRITPDTKFRIDMGWWEREGNYRLFLWEQLCPECKEQIPTHVGTQEVDWIDPVTAEVKKTDAIIQCLESICAQKPDYLHASLPLATAIFRVLVLHKNQPMSARELREYIPWYTEEQILAALKAAQRYLGIFPEWATGSRELPQAA